LIQLLLASAGDGWKNKGYKIAEGSVDSEGKVITNPDKVLIESKLNQTCHQFALTVATSAPDSRQSSNILSNIVGTFAAFSNAKSNSFKTHTPLFGKQNFIESIVHRDFTGTKPQYLSISEIASLWHMPYLQT